MLSSDHQLLKQHLRHPSGGALTTLIERFLPLVLSVARRITANDEAARDISQTVFLRLIKKAPNIPSTLPLTAWFHRETHSASVDHVRSEVRRQQREQTAASLNTMKITPDPWPQLAPEIDGAINELPENDRSLVLLRFYDNQTHLTVFNDAGPIVVNPADVGGIAARAADWQFGQFYPSSCVNCDDMGDSTAIVDWRLANDSTISEAIYETDGDATNRFFLNIPTQIDFRDLIVPAHGLLNAAYPNRYKRFIVSGDDSHTALQSPLFYSQNANGFLLNEWTSDFLVPTPFWEDLVEDFVPLP